MKNKMIGICAYFLVVISALGSEVLVPLDNGEYKKMKIEEVMPQNISEEPKEVIQAELEQKVNYIPYEVVLFEDLLFLSLDYENNSFDLKDIKKNKNLFKRKIAEDFIEESKIDKNIDEDMYLFSINTFKDNSKFKGVNDTKLKNTGLIIGFQYGITDKVNTKLNIGYSHSKVENSKSDNLFLSSDTRYSYDGDISYNLGLKLGYLNGNNLYYTTEDMFLGLVYGQIDIPLTDSIKLSSELESSLISNKVNLGLSKEIELEFSKIKASVSSDYIFRYSDKDKKLYTHIANEKPTVKVEVAFNKDHITAKTFYEFINENAGLGIEYKF